ncbi:MAG: hypothetical protein ACP5DC_10835, partial [Halothiobacillaceae bacterium]
VIYNINIESALRRGEGDRVGVLQLKRSIQAGRQITEADLQVIEIPQETYDRIGKPLTEEQKYLALKYKPVKDLERGDWVLQSDIIKDLNQRTAASLDQKKVGVPIHFDPNNSPGKALGHGDRVNAKAITGVPPRLRGGHACNCVLIEAAVECARGLAMDLS